MKKLILAAALVLGTTSVFAAKPSFVKQGCDYKQKGAAAFKKAYSETFQAAKSFAEMGLGGTASLVAFSSKVKEVGTLSYDKAYIFTFFVQNKYTNEITSRKVISGGSKKMLGTCVASDYYKQEPAVDVSSPEAGKVTWLRR